MPIRSDGKRELACKLQAYSHEDGRRGRSSAAASRRPTFEGSAALRVVNPSDIPATACKTSLPWGGGKTCLSLDAVGEISKSCRGAQRPRRIQSKNSAQVAEAR